MNEPLGWNVGHQLEVEECADFLKGKQEAGLAEVTFALAAEMLVLASRAKLSVADAREECRREIAAGKPRRVFERMFEAQGGDWKAFELHRKQLDSRPRHPVRSPTSGSVSRVDALAPQRSIGGGQPLFGKGSVDQLLGTSPVAATRPAGIRDRIHRGIVPAASEPAVRLRTSCERTSPASGRCPQVERRRRDHPRRSAPTPVLRGYADAMTIAPAMIDLLGRAALDLLTMLLLVGWLYKSAQSVPSMPLVLSSLNVGIFSAVTVFTYAEGAISAGVGFGLFALLSMLRLRSAAFTIKDVAFTFLVLITGLVNSLPTDSWGMLISVNLAILLVVLITDTHRESKTTRVMAISIKEAYSDPSLIRAAVEEKLGMAVESIVIKEINFAKGITDLKVEYHPDPSLGRAVSESMADNSSGRGDD
jgi:hypothetical protein